MDEDTTFYATMYQGAIRTLNEKYPLLYRTRAGAIRESRRFTGVSVVSVNARDFDLAQCSIDDTWPTGISTPGCLPVVAAPLEEIVDGDTSIAT